MTFSPITAVIDGPTDTRAAVVFPPCCTDAALLPPCQGLQPQSERMKSLKTHSQERDAAIAEAARLERIGDRKGRKSALARARAATMAVLACEARQ